MSGILKKIGKVFKKVISSKIFKVIAIAAAVYFTAGVALAAGGSAFAASLPGITAAGQMVGLAGTGAIAAEAAVTAASVASAANISAGVMSGAADLAAGGIATEGIGATIAATTAGDIALAGADALSGAAEGGGGAFASAPTTSSGFGGVGTDAAVSGVKSGVQTAASAGKTAAEAGGNSLMTWMEKNPVVSKAAMTFGTEGLKTGIGMFAQKSQQESADARYQQDRTDRVRLNSSPILTNPSPGGRYNTGVVDSVTGLITGAPKP
jgi:hypothetical protein